MHQAYRGWIISFDPRRPGDKAWRGVWNTHDSSILNAVSKGALKRKINARVEERASTEGAT